MARAVLAAAVLLLGCVVPVSAVLYLHPDNFDHEVASRESVAVAFTRGAASCTHCKQLDREWSEASKALEGIVAFGLVNVDAPGSWALAEEHGVTGFPTIVLFTQGRREIYWGPRSTKAIVAYVKHATRPLLLPLSQLPQEGVRAVGAVRDPSSEEYTVLQSFCANVSSMTPCALVSSDDAISLAGMPRVPGLVLQRDFAEKVTFHGEWTTEALRRFHDAHSVPLLDRLSQRHVDRFTRSTLPKVLYVSESGEPPQRTADALREAARLLAGRVVFSWALPTQHHVLTSFALDQLPKPLMAVLVDGSRYVRSLSDDKATAQLVTRFVDDVLAGKVDPIVKTEPIPTEETGVRRVVASTLPAMLHEDVERDRLLLVYSEWCDHSRRFLPAFLAAGTALAEAGIDVGMIDGTRNDIPATLHVSVYPSVFFLRGGDDRAILYTGPRSARSISEFVKARASSLQFDTSVLSDDEAVRELPPEGLHDSFRLAAAEALSLLTDPLPIGGRSVPTLYLVFAILLAPLGIWATAEAVPWCLHKLTFNPSQHPKKTDDPPSPPAHRAKSPPLHRVVVG